MKDPLVSVIIPAYNAEKHINSAIQSTLDQTWQNLEVIIVNDGSTDNTENVIQPFLSSSRVKYIKQENSGCSGAKNTGLDYVNGEFLQYLDADDILSPNKIEEQVQALKDKPENIAISKTVLFTTEPIIEKSKEVDSEYIYSTNNGFDLLLNLYSNGGMIQPNAFLIPKPIYKKIGLWDLSISPATDEDSEYFCRAILAGNGIIFTENCYNFYRSDSSIVSLSRKPNASYLEGTLKTINKRAEHLLEVESSIRVKNAIAHLYSRFMYGNYSKFPNLVKHAEENIYNLGLKNIPITGGPSFTKMARIIGMKNALHLREFLNIKPKM